MAARVVIDHINWLQSFPQVCIPHATSVALPEVDAGDGFMWHLRSHSQGGTPFGGLWIHGNLLNVCFLSSILNHNFAMFWRSASLQLYFNRLAPVSRRPGPHASQQVVYPQKICGCNRTCDCTCIKNCFPLQKFFTSFFVHHPSRKKNPRNQKHPQFHPVINEHGNKRLRHPILLPFFSCPRSRSWAHRIVAWHTTTLHKFSGNWPPVSTTQEITIWKSGPNLSRARGESSLRPFACKLGSLPTTPNLGGQPIHTRAFAT